MLCAQCGTELLPGKKFCHACGAAAAAACPSCGARVDPSWRFCPECGRGLGEAAASPSGRAVVVPAPAGSPAPSGSAPATAPVATDPRVARITEKIPETLATRIRSAGAVAGERKRATVFFCDLVGSTALAERLDPEVYRELLDRYLELVFAEIYRFEGIVNQLAGDGLMALFGAPIAHEDAPERAVRAALAIQASLGEYSKRLLAERGVALRARVGIHTGIVVAGTVGNDLKMDYTAIGDTTNLAARLQSLAAPGTIVVSEATHALLRGGFRTTPLGPFDVKGKREPVTAHQVLGLAKRAPAFSGERGELTPLVGREAELAQLEGCFDRLETGLAQVVSIVGEAGIGKSRLVHALKKRLEGRAFEVMETRCSSLTRSVPYAPWTAMLRGWFGVTPGDDERCACEKIGKRLTELSGTRDSDYSDLCWMLALPVERKGEPESEPAKHRGFTAVSRVIERTSRRVPVVMIFEDLHWLDDASRETLEKAVAHAGGRLMILTTHRPEYRPTWQPNGAFTQLRLRPLGADDAGRIVRARAGGAVPREVEERILRKADGNPFYLEELTRALVEDGTLVARDGQVTVTRRSEEIRIPDTIGEVLSARIDRLRPAAKRAAQVASVLGRQFSRRHLERLLESEPIEVDNELGELERRGVLHRSGSMAIDELRFGESLTQEVAYEGLLLRERRSLHDRVAEILEAESRDPTQAGDARGRLALAAHHLARGDDPERGIKALLAAGQHALSLPSYGDAMRLYREAWQLAEATLDETREPTLALKRIALEAAVGICAAAAVYGDSETEASDRAPKRGLALAEEVGDLDLHANLLASYGLVTMNGQRERFADGMRMVEKSVELARRVGSPMATFRAARGLILAYILDARFADARRLVDELLASFESSGDAERGSDVYMGARFFRGRLLLDSESFEEADEWLRESLERAELAGNRTVRSASASMLASIAFQRGEYDEAERLANIALPIAEAIESLAAIRSAAATLLLVRAQRDDASVTTAELEQLERGLLSSGDLGNASETIVEALLEHGEVARARRLVEARVARAGGRMREAKAALSLGLVALGSGPDQLGSAERDFGEAVARAKECGLNAVQGRAWLGLAEVARARGDEPAKVAHAQAAITLLRPLGLDHYASRAARLLLDRLEESSPNA
ncbi:MAG: adenylate/guanylate cyclase domain-containing protein [Myxococcota bacterium]